jgi:cell division protein FtsW (lipid II flippase)
VNRWQRPRPAIVVYCDIALLVLCVVFRDRTGRAMWWLGLRCKRFIPAEFAHNASLWLIRWQYWRPSVWKD